MGFRILAPNEERVFIVYALTGKDLVPLVHANIQEFDSSEVKRFWMSRIRLRRVIVRAAVWAFRFFLLYAIKVWTSLRLFTAGFDTSLFLPSLLLCFIMDTATIDDSAAPLYSLFFCAQYRDSSKKGADFPRASKARQIVSSLIVPRACS